MTQTYEQAGKIGKLKSLFVALNEKGQQSALAVLRSLQFAQSVLENEKKSGDKRNQKDA